MQADLYLHYSEGLLTREKYLAQKEEYRLERLSSENRVAERCFSLQHPAFTEFEYRFYFIPIFENNFKCFRIIDINGIGIGAE